MDILCWVSFTALPSILCPPCCVFLVSGQCPWVSFAALPSENCWLGVFLKDTLLVSHPPYNVPPCCVSPVSGQCPLVSLGVPGWCSPLNQCNHTNSPTGRTLTLRCTLLTMMQFAGNDSPFWLVLYQQSLFSSNPDFVISEVLHNFCSSSSSITFFSICSQKFGQSLKSPSSRHLSCLKLHSDSLNRLQHCHSLCCRRKMDAKNLKLRCGFDCWHNSPSSWSPKESSSSSWSSKEWQSWWAGASPGLGWTERRSNSCR